MDTRNKIIDLAQAEAILGDSLKEGAQPVKVVRGYFDPLTAAHARRLTEVAAGKHLLVIVSTPPDSILPLRARGELVAGLAVVDSVLLTDEGEADRFIVQFKRAAFLDERAADERRRLDLVERVIERQRVK